MVSDGSKFVKIFDHLSVKSLLQKVIHDSMIMGSHKWKTLAPDRAGMILDVASEYFKHHRFKKQTELEAEY
jgi:hypothetical protein